MSSREVDILVDAGMTTAYAHPWHDVLLGTTHSCFPDRQRTS